MRLKESVNYYLQLLSSVNLFQINIISLKNSFQNLNFYAFAFIRSGSYVNLPAIGSAPGDKTKIRGIALLESA